MQDTSTVDKQIGQRLAAARTHAGLTLRELAARLHWDHSTLSSYERGRRSLSVPRLVAIAQALGLSPASFLVSIPEAATVVNYIDGNLERCLQVGIVLESLEHDVPADPQDTWRGATNE